MGQRYIRYEVVPLNEFLAEIYQYWNKTGTHIQRPNGKWVGCTSLRLKTFARGAKQNNGVIKCVGCDLEATHFAVESSPGQIHTHMNLYGMKNGAEVLFTHDHILARGLGGADDLSNTQVMCAPCNSYKSREEGREANRRRKLAEEQAEKNDTV